MYVITKFKLVLLETYLKYISWSSVYFFPLKKTPVSYVGSKRNVQSRKIMWINRIHGASCVRDLLWSTDYSYVPCPPHRDYRFPWRAICSRNLLYCTLLHYMRCALNWNVLCEEEVAKQMLFGFMCVWICMITDHMTLNYNNNNNRAGVRWGLWLVIKIKVFVQYTKMCSSYEVYKRGLPEITRSVSYSTFNSLYNEVHESPFWNSSAGTSSVPSDITFQLCGSNVKFKSTGLRQQYLMCISICLTFLAPRTFNSWKKWVFHVFNILWKSATRLASSSCTILVPRW